MLKQSSVLNRGTRVLRPRRALGRPSGMADAEPCDGGARELSNEPLFVVGARHLPHRHLTHCRAAPMCRSRPSPLTLQRPVSTVASGEGAVGRSTGIRQGVSGASDVGGDRDEVPERRPVLLPPRCESRCPQDQVALGDRVGNDQAALPLLRVPGVRRQSYRHLPGGHAPPCRARSSTASSGATTRWTRRRGRTRCSATSSPTSTSWRL